MLARPPRLCWSQRQRMPSSLCLWKSCSSMPSRRRAQSCRFWTRDCMVMVRHMELHSVILQLRMQNLQAGRVKSRLTN